MNENICTTSINNSAERLFWPGYKLGDLHGPSNELETASRVLVKTVLVKPEGISHLVIDG